MGKSADLIGQEQILEGSFLQEMKIQGIQRCVKPEKRKPKDAPQYHVVYLFHFGSDNTFGYHKSDLTNLMEIVSDSLTKVGIIEDDRFIHSVDGSRKLLSDKTYLEVYVLKYKGE